MRKIKINEPCFKLADKEIQKIITIVVISLNLNRKLNNTY